MVEESRLPIVVGAAANSAGPTATFAPMPFPDDPDDDAGFVPPLPQDDRLWRHPSEMAGPNPISSRAKRRYSSRTGFFAVIAIGLIATTTGIAAVGILGSSDRAPRGTEFAVGPAAEALPETALSSLAPAIVQIKVDRASGSFVVTGLIIRSDGHVVTASDPLEGARSLTVTTADGRAFNATIVGTDPADDLAVIAIQGSGLPTPSFGDINSVAQGDTVFVVGRTPTDNRSWVASAIFQAVGVRLDTTDGSTLHDMIGSAIDVRPPTDSAVLCTKTGEVIGLLTSRAAAATRSAALAAVPSTLALPSATNSFAHSVAWTRHVVDDIIETGSVHHGWLGVMTTDAPEGGAAIESVTRYGPADRAGLIAGDRVTSLSNANLPTSSALVVALRNHAANDTITIGYVRNGIAATTFATLIDRS